MSRTLKILAMVATAIVAVAVVAHFGTQPASPFTKLKEMQLGRGEVGVLLLGYSSCVIKTSQHMIIVDSAETLSQTAVTELGKVHAILVTHEHSDHFVAGATSQLCRWSDATVVANRGAYDEVKGLIQTSGKLVKLEPGETATVEGIFIEALAANHSGLLPVMFVITVDGVTILHASDSGFSPSLERFKGRIDLALVPTGVYSPTASPSEAFKIAATVLPKKVVAFHGSSDQHSEFQRLLSGAPSVGFVEVRTLNPQKISFA